MGKIFQFLSKDTSVDYCSWDVVNESFIIDTELLAAEISKHCTIPYETILEVLKLEENALIKAGVMGDE